MKEFFSQLTKTQKVCFICSLIWLCTFRFNDIGILDIAILILLPINIVLSVKSYKDHCNE
ncbi:MAG: hypothetical protein ACRC1Y_02585 [Paraclostridium sp.]